MVETREYKVLVEVEIPDRPEMAKVGSTLSLTDKEAAGLGKSVELTDAEVLKDVRRNDLTDAEAVEFGRGKKPVVK